MEADGLGKMSYTELIEINRRNKIFVEQAPNALAMFDKQMRYLAASQQWLRDYRLEGIEIIGHSHYEIFPEIGDDWKQIHNECLMGAINKNSNAYFRRKDGTEQWLEWDVRPWYISEGVVGGLLMYTADVTGRKKMEDQLQLSQQQFRNVFEYSATGMAIIAKDGKWLQVNDTLCEILGYTRTELLNMKFSDITYQDDLAKDVELMNELLEGKKNYYYLEKRYIHKSGNLIWVILCRSLIRDKDGMPLYFAAQVTDINKQKAAQEQLQSTLVQLESLLDASTQVSIIGTDTSGLITTFNRGAENLLGYSRDEMLHKATPERLHVKEEIERREQELSVLLHRSVKGFNVFTERAKEEKYETREWTYVRKNGTKFPVQLTVTAVRDKSEIIGYLGIGADISEIKRVEQEILSLLDVTNDQNERLKNFAHIVSHNLRAHSGNLGSLIDIFFDEHPEMADNELLQLFKTASENLKETIAQLTEVVLFKTTLADNLVPLNLRTVTETAIQNIAMLAKDAGVTITDSVDPTINVLGIGAYLDSVLLNFLTNSIKYRAPHRARFIKLNTAISGEFAVLSIEDNGLGMDLNKMGDKLFGMYKTFHGNKDARGIGLFITHNQVEALGGKIEVESEVGKGTTFRVYFRTAG